jgi:hypothetical protein
MVKMNVISNSDSSSVKSNLNINNIYNLINDDSNTTLKKIMLLILKQYHHQVKVGVGDEEKVVVMAIHELEC